MLIIASPVFIVTTVDTQEQVKIKLLKAKIHQRSLLSVFTCAMSALLDFHPSSSTETTLRQQSWLSLFAGGPLFFERVGGWAISEKERNSRIAKTAENKIGQGEAWEKNWASDFYYSGPIFDI